MHVSKTMNDGINVCFKTINHHCLPKMGIADCLQDRNTNIETLENCRFNVEFTYIHLDGLRQIKMRNFGSCSRGDD